MTHDQNSDPLGILGRVSELEAKAKASQLEIAALEAEIAELVKIPENGAVTVTFDDTGLMTSLVIDTEVRKALDARGLINDINFAIARSKRSPMVSTLSPSDSVDEASGRIEQLFTMANAASSGDPKVFRNDLGSIAITSVWGTIVNIECSESWIDAASDTAIADEIVSAARAAGLADDPLGLRKGAKQ